MKLYHGSPKLLNILRPHKGKGEDSLENKKAIFLTSSFKNAALYSLGKTLKGKTCFALPPNKLIILGRHKLSEGYVYQVNIKPSKGSWDQYLYEKPIKDFKVTKVYPKKYLNCIKFVKSKEELIAICDKEKLKWLKKNHKIPQLKFKSANINTFINVMYRFLNHQKGDWNWKDKILYEYPTLKRKLRSIKKIPLREKIIYDFFLELSKREKIKINCLKIRFQKEWDKINDRYMLYASEATGITWPSKLDKIKVSLSPNPICPRDLKKYNFQIYYRFKIKQMKAVCMHEIFHFIYFEKVREVFSRNKQKSNRILSLHLSEITASVVLNSCKIQQIMKYHHKTYREYHKVIIKNKTLVQHIAKIYGEAKNFRDFLLKADKFMALNRKIILKRL